MSMSFNTAFSATKAITIARVSTDEQEEYSPAAQNTRMLDYCDRHGLTILESHEITESSTKGDRKEFCRLSIKLPKPLKAG